jgi:glutamate/tyrosine decarboxylase-like PLP-dependent enzyme
LCRYFYEEVQKLGFEVGPYPELSVMIYRYPFKENSNDKNLKLADEVRKDGKVFLSTTTIDGIVYIRLAVLSFRTHIDIIDYLLALLAKKIKEI